ncbi:stromal interaction molecule 2-like [Lampris incognitus]|uniref:stromal interaction molecule 2-like n=1 Tax=Lampris incognitus TaxID=2546036 RepID=UPI0024B5AD8B|nr:stromal interaction molecule 2-like [Lampris incognitus]
MVVSPPCMSEADRYSLEALRNIHHMMDDDQDGGIEVEESVEFIIEDMKQQQTNKHNNLHREDQHITVEELWRGWKSSEVHNWTQDEVLRWLKDFVELPQYERNFKDFKVNGNTLPRIAANEPSFLSGQLRVQDQRDKQKLNIKALDVVLFGPPTRPPHNYMKDLLLIVSVVMGLGGCWFAQFQNKASKIHISKMMKDLESLQKAEQSLRELQEQLERAQEEKRNVAEEKQNLEEKMRDEIMGAQEEANRLHELRQGAVSELSRLRYAEEELEQVLGALKQAEKDVQASWSASEALQLWLQLTHEVEVQYYNIKKQSAELQLTTVKEEAEKIKKKRSSLLGTLHIAHSSSLDQVDHKILEAKNALSEVTACLRERLHRWQQIERLCGFPILRNTGLANLMSKLYSEPSILGLSRLTQPSYPCHSSVQGSMEDLKDDPTSPIKPQMPVAIPQMKRSPRSRGSAICRSRRPGVITQPPASMISQDPDILIPIRAPFSCFEEEEGLFHNPQKRQDSQELFPDTDYMAPLPASRTFSSTSSVDSTHKIYRDDMEMFADSSVRKSSSKELDAVVESPVCKISVEELENSADFSSRKMVKDKSIDIPLDTAASKMSKEDTDSLIDAASRKISRDRTEVSLDASIDLVTSKVDRDTVGVLKDTASRNLYRDRSDLSLDVTVRKMLWNEIETSPDVVTRKISRDVMGLSLDSASRKTLRDELELPFDSVSRKISRDSVGMSLDTVSRKLVMDKGEYQLDSPVRTMTRDKMIETAATPLRKISRDELEYSSESTLRKILPREKMEALIDTSSRKVSGEKQEFSLELSASRRILRDELEMPAGFVRRRIARDKIDSSIDTPTGKMSWDRVGVALEMPKQKIVGEKFVLSEPSISPGQMGQPDLTITSLEMWNPSSDLFSPDPLSQLVYDGILEKSCTSMATTASSLGDLSASTHYSAQSMLTGELDPPLTSPRIPIPSPSATSPERAQEKNTDKEKSKKTSKLKNFFKKKKDSASERPQSGLQKL